ncbi:MAG: DUF1566 domain-containing protein [Pseudomonadota bacterium]
MMTIEACGRRRMALGIVLLAVAGPVQAADWNPLPDSGQTKCYDAGGAEITCPPAGQPLHGQDGHYQAVVPAYQDNGNKTVTDRNSGLIWMKADDAVKRSWQDAIDYCDELAFAGHSDWRLPVKFELDSIVDYGRSYPAVHPALKSRASFYWSSTPYLDDPVYAWGSYANDGGDHWLDTSNRYYVRCVRAGL